MNVTLDKKSVTPYIRRYFIKAGMHSVILTAAIRFFLFTTFAVIIAMEQRASVRQAKVITITRSHSILYINVPRHILLNTRMDKHCIKNTQQKKSNK